MSSHWLNVGRSCYAHARQVRHVKAPFYFIHMNVIVLRIKVLRVEHAKRVLSLFRLSIEALGLS